MITEAAVFFGVERAIEVREIELREPRPGEVRVRMHAVGICGTDLHVVKGDWTRPLPMVLGHEGAGVLESVGDGVSGLAAGDHVVLSWAPSCRACADCARGRPAACRELQRAVGAGTLPDGTTGMELDGKPLYRGTATGALARDLVVNAGAVMPLASGVPLEHAALLGCAALTGVGAVLFQAQVTPGNSVLILGAGGVGQFCVQGARIADAEAILVVDPNRERLELAQSLGATGIATPEELETLLKETTLDGVDVSIDAVGAPETTALALRAARNGGRAVVVGLGAAGDRLDLDPAEFSRREKELTGSMYGSQDPRVALPVLLDYVRNGALRLAPLVGPRYPLERVDEAVRMSLSGPQGRVIVEM